MTEKKAIESLSEKPPITLQKLIRTILLVLSWFILGLCGEIIGPTMTILAHNIQVTFNGIASVLASGSAGGLITNIFCGIFQNFTNNYSELMLTTGFFLSTLLMCITPFIHSLIPMCTIFFLQGVSSSFVNMGGTNLLIDMWSIRVATPLNIVHLGYGFGAISANLLVRPFLNDGNDTLSSPSFNTTIRTPYLISGILCFLIGLGHLIFCVQKQLEKSNPNEIQQIDQAIVETVSLQCDTRIKKTKFPQYSPRTCGNGSFTFGLILSLLFIMYIFFVSGTDQIFAKFYFSFLKQDKFAISSNDASWGVICYWLSYSIGRLVCAVLSIFLPVYICLTITWCAGLFLAVIWNIYVWVFGLTIGGLFILGSLTGFIIAPLFPLSFAWFTQNLNVIPPLLAALLCACGLGSLILQKIAGILMDMNQNHFPTLLTGSIIITMILYIISSVVIFFHKRNVKTRRNSLVNDEEEEQQMKDRNNIRKNSIILSF
ncbi:hypothetical protein I4U23_022960 [Adineta vaga]|nr:hypothetical protein I4U23_022960 [Adineta vaga]